jgi:signal transduction histidine kinase
MNCPPPPPGPTIFQRSNRGAPAKANEASAARKRVLRHIIKPVTALILPEQGQMVRRWSHSSGSDSSGGWKAGLATEYAFINAHKLRSPLASILGLVNLMRKVDLKDDEKEILERLNGASEKLEGIVRDITIAIQKGDQKRKF